MVPTTPACTRWNRPEEDISSGKSESTHPSRTVVKSIEVLMESNQLYAATLTHYSTEPLTIRPNYDPLLLMLALAGDVHANPGPSLAKVPATCVQDVRIGYIQDVLFFETLRIIVKPMEFSPLSSFVIRCRFGDLIIHCRHPCRGGILLA